MSVRHRDDRNGKKAVHTEHAQNNVHFDGPTMIRSGPHSTWACLGAYVSGHLCCPHWRTETIWYSAMQFRPVDTQVCSQLKVCTHATNHSRYSWMGKMKFCMQAKTFRSENECLQAFFESYFARRLTPQCVQALCESFIRCTTKKNVMKGAKSCLKGFTKHIPPNTVNE